MSAHMDHTIGFKQEVDLTERDHTELKIEEHDIEIEYGSIVNSNLEVSGKNFLSLNKVINQETYLNAPKMY